MDKQEILDMFKNNKAVKVVFIKSNGDHRTMICTKDLDEVPVHDRPTGENKRKTNDHVCVVYEYGVGWRSFVFDRVISAEPTKI